MAEDQREARIAAEQACLEQLGVKFEYVQYADNTTVSLLQSVMAGNPVCDIAVLWGGSENTILAQNIVKNLDSFAYLFEENESMSWMLDAPLYGHHYLLSDVVRFMPRWPLCYNISMIEAVDSLKDANGNTIYPNTLFDEGKWTWSAFKDSLERSMHSTRATPRSMLITQTHVSQLFPQHIPQALRSTAQTDSVLSLRA